MDLKGRKAIVTGGAGFIGSALVGRLLGEGADVLVLDNLWRGSLANLDDATGGKFDADNNFRLVDLTDYAKCLEHVRDADIVFHLADIVAGVDYVFSNEGFVFRQNVLINTNVLGACLTNAVPNYLYVGTACSYPQALQMVDGIAALREDQTYPAHPESGYGWSKLMGEYEAELAQKSKRINVGLLRFHNVYGPRTIFEPSRSQALPALIRKAIRYPAEDFVVWGSGDQYRDFVYVDDVVEAILLTARRGLNCGLIQIGSERATTLREAAETVVRISGKPIEIRYDRSKPEGDRGRIAICDRARDLLGWRPRVDFVTGMERTYEWIKGKIASDDAC